MYELNHLPQNEAGVLEAISKFEIIYDYSIYS